MPTDPRITTLETQVRTLKKLLVAAFGTAALAGLLAATSLQNIPEVVQARKFQVVNANGQVVAQMGATNSGTGEVLTWDTKNIIAVMNTGFSTKNPNTPSQPPQPKPAPPPAANSGTAVEAMTVSKEFGDNKLAAETKYRRMGEFVLVGKYHDIGEVMSSNYDTITVVMLDEDTNWENPSIAVQNLKRSFIETLNKGQTVRVKVKYRMNCELTDTPVFQAVP